VYIIASIKSTALHCILTTIVRDKIGKEIISRFHVPFYQNNQTFYTDSNGREMLKRVLNYRPSFRLRENVENVSGNYYPITSRITLTDARTQMSVLNDRSQGGSSLENGAIELMVTVFNIFRRCFVRYCLYRLFSTGSDFGFIFDLSSYAI